MIKGSLLLSAPIVKLFRRKKLKSSVFSAKIWRFWGINRGLILNLEPRKGTSLRDFTSNKLSRVRIHQPVWPVRESQKKKV